MSSDIDSPGAAGNREGSTSLQVSLQPVGYGSTGKLFDDIYHFLTQHPGLEANSIGLLTYFVFASLFLECARIWPFPSVVAADGAASTLLLRMLECIFVRPVHIGEVTLTGIMSLPESPSQILLIDQPVPGKELQRVLRMMSRPGAAVPRKGKLRDICRPVVLCTVEPLRDPWLQDQAIHVVLAPARSRLPKFDQQLLDETSRKLRGKLVQYRENSVAKVCGSQFDVPEFSSPTREIAALLGSCIVDDTELQARVITLLRNQDRDARVRRENSFQAILAEAGLFLNHEPHRTEARVGEVTTIANGILRGRGETLQLEPRAVGDLLRSLGLFSERLGPAGRGIRFHKEVRQKIHELAWAFNVRSLQDKVDRCEFCAGARVRFAGTPEPS